MIDQGTLALLLKGVNAVTWQSLVMLGVSFVLFYLAIVKDYEPLLLLPIAAGCMLANLPLSPLVAEDGMLKTLYNMGVGNEMFPLLIFIGIGALTDFGPLLENPRLVLLGAAGQFGIFLTLLLALLLGFTQPEAASIGIIGAIDGPTSIYVSGILAPHLVGPITVAAYSYMSLVPVIMPPVIYALTTKSERAIVMEYSSRKISKRTRIMFPIIVTVMVGTLVPFATPLIGMLMLGNLMRESKVVERLTQASSNELANVVTLFLGLAIGSTMKGEDFLKVGTLAILGLGLLAVMVYIIRARLTVDRIIGINLVGTIVVMVIVVLTFLLGEDYLADIALIYVVLSFIAVMMLCRIYINLYQRNQRKKEEASHDR